MIWLTLLLSSLTADSQVLAGSAFEAFARRAEAVCPARGLRAITPGDLDWEEDGYQATLSARSRRRLAVADRAGQLRCADRNGLSCSAEETLAAMRRGAMLGSFTRFACSHVPPG